MPLNVRVTADNAVGVALATGQRTVTLYPPRLLFELLAERVGVNPCLEKERSTGALGLQDAE